MQSRLSASWFDFTSGTNSSFLANTGCAVGDISDVSVKAPRSVGRGNQKIGMNLYIAYEELPAFLLHV